MIFTPDAVRRIADLLAEAARAEILPRFNRLQAEEVRTKSSAVDLVTDADEAAERMIGAQLSAWYPDALIIGEEAATRDPALLDRLGDAPLAFVIDPVDGTRNFVAGLPAFGVMAAAIVHGEIVAGIIHDPIGRNTCLGIRDGGAWMEFEGGTSRRLAVAPPDDVAKMEAVAGVGFLSEPMRTQVACRLARFRSTTSLRCAAQEYRLAVTGDCHVLMYNKLMPWDHAAGWLLHREAGGFSAHYDGTPYRPTQRSGGLLFAPDEASWRTVRDAVLGDGA